MPKRILRLIAYFAAGALSGSLVGVLCAIVEYWLLGYYKGAPFALYILQVGVFQYCPAAAVMGCLGGMLTNCQRPLDPKLFVLRNSTLLWMLIGAFVFTVLIILGGWPQFASLTKALPPHCVHQFGRGLRLGVKTSIDASERYAKPLCQDAYSGD